MDLVSLPRYEMGRCFSCGYCNTDPPSLEPDGTWVRFEDIVEFVKNNTWEGLHGKEISS